MTRGRSSARFEPVGRLLAGAGLAVLALVALARPVAAEDPQRYNCPDGFGWIRMSGTACVQQIDTLPTNGKIGYDGHALCVDPYAGIYEARPTTDGKPPPGAPYTSFAFLLECVTPEEYARRAAAGMPGDVTELLVDGPVRLPPAQDLVIIGLTATGGLLIAASRFKPPPAGSVPWPQPAEAPAVAPPPAPGVAELRAADGPGPTSDTLEPLPTDPDQVRRKLDELRQIDEDLAQLAAAIAAAADPGTLTAIDYVTFLGVLADLVAAIPVPPVQLVAGGVSIGSSLSLAIADAAEMDPRAVYRDLRGRLDDIARMRGIIAADRDLLQQRLDAPAPPPREVPDRLDVDPSLLPDDTLREERVRAEQWVERTYRADHANGEKVLRLMEQRNRQEDKIRDLRRVLDAIDSGRDSTVREVTSDATTGTDLVAGVGGFIDKWHEDWAQDLMTAAQKAKVATVGEADFGMHARGVLAAEGFADEAKVAGKWATAAGVGAAAATGLQWYQEFSGEQQRLIVEHAIEDLSRRAGQLGQQVARAEQDGTATASAFHDAAAHRNALRAELMRRASEHGHVLWTQ